VFAAFVLLVLLIGGTPAIVFSDGVATGGVVAFLTAMALGVVAAEIGPGDSGYVAKLVRPPLLLMAVPAIWMLVQLVPMPFGSLSHPMWASAAEALDRPISGHISIDLGATVMGLSRYLTAIGILVAATAIAIDRTRAEWMLYWLTGATAVSAAILVTRHLAGFAETEASATLHAASALGSIVAAAATIKSVERYETRRNNAEMSLTKFGRSLGVSLLALTICCLAVVFAAPVQVAFAAECGLATVVVVVIVRRFALAPLPAGALAAVAIIAAIAIATGKSNMSGDLAVRFAAEPAPSTVSMVERMIADNAVGTGVSTFKALAPIYRDIGDAAVPATAPTTAVQLTIEMGRLALWIVVLLMMAATALLLRGAVVRGRDSFYATGGAGCAIALMAEAFTDASLLGTTISILAASILGLGLAQSASRTSK
jgi:hypothetical protein